MRTTLNKILTLSINSLIELNVKLGITSRRLNFHHFYINWVLFSIDCKFRWKKKRKA